MKLQKIKSIGKYNNHSYIHTYKCKGCNNIKNGRKMSKIEYITRYCRTCGTKFWLGRNISLRFYKNKNIENHISITDFCNKHPELGENAKYHFHEVLNGKRVHYKGWLDANNKIKIDIKKVKKIEQIIIKPFIYD